ncbi:HWE histidine kinase domain-containing protein [Bosea sp. 124]|uniref:sensor histidine kinase n=1 Tax=Bosea sp. 124 TaxID=2135642 RepID=UPI000D427F62|nr:HWE histidine kinase domain-containing protein [Bosea sp. 124]PTM41403.1 PAS domain S-box-containing protein [Bosea sp. 124]
MSERLWPVGGGEVGALLRSWTGAETVLGPSSAWPERLKSTLQLVLASPTPMVMFWGPSGLLLYNDAYGVIAGAKHPGILGLGVFDAWPEVIDLHEEVMRTVFGGAPLSYRDLPLVLHRNGVAEDVCLNVDYSPIFDEGGEVLGVLAVVIETTALVGTQRARDEAEQALRRRERELAQVQKIGKVGGLEVDLRDGFHNKRSPEYLLIHGLPPEAVHESHENWVRRIHPQERAMVESHFRETLAGTARDYQIDYRIIRPSDGAVRWISAVAQIERDEAGQPVRLVGAHLDITERKEAEAQQRLLMQELAHRVKNTLAMIQAIASQTLRGATSLEAANETFSARLAALSRAHDLVVGGHRANARMVDIAGSVVGIQGDPARFQISGPDVLLGPRPALALTLVLHELATNAVKYGALSNQSGIVVLSWRVDEIDGAPQFRLRWQESGGPPVVAPSRRGFGSRLIERTFPSAQGRAESAYLPTGLVFTLDAPLEALKDGREENGEPA